MARNSERSHNASIHNEIKGTIKAATKGGIVAVITTRSVKHPAAAAGDAVSAESKATNVSVCTCNCDK